MNTAKRTPGEWKVEGKDDEWKLMTGDGRMIAVINGRRPAIIEDGINAHFICQAVNSHDALVDAVEWMRDHIRLTETVPPPASEDWDDWNTHLSALKLAKGGE